MAITLWRNRKPFQGLTGFFDDVDRWFDNDFTDTDWYDKPRFGDSWTPAIDIEENDGKYMLRADLPGMKKEDIHVELKDGYLTLRGERKSEHKDHHEGYHRIERTYGSFSRSFRVPEGVTEKDVKAKYHDGVLELCVPAPKVEKPKAVEVKVE